MPPVGRQSGLTAKRITERPQEWLNTGVNSESIATTAVRQGFALMIRFRIAIIAALAGPSVAGAVIPFDVRYESEAVGIQTTTATFSVGGVETFDARATGTSSFTTDFGTSGAITGAYSNVQVNNNDQYGGAGGTGKYAVTFANVGYSLDLSSTITGGVNYFGYWLSALDRGNRVTFYRGGAVLFTFNPTDVLGVVNASANSSSYYGNPNAAYRGRNSREPYIFLNFFSDRGSFDRVVFTETPAGGGYESDNHTVGHFLTKGTGTSVRLSVASFPVGSIPEPAVWGMMVTGFGLVGVSVRRRVRTVAA